MSEIKENSHLCQISSDIVFKMTCLGAIQGKVLSIEIVPDKHDGTDEPCLKIRINEWVKNLRHNKDYVVYYGIIIYGKRNPPEIGKVYQFFLHKVEGRYVKYSQHGWQWTHDWLLA